MTKDKGAATTVTFRVDEEVLQQFRMAISKKHKGIIRGTTFVEFNEALRAWTKVMNGKARIVSSASTPVFGETAEE